MAKIKLNPLFQEFSGTMGDFVFKKSKKKGEAIVSLRPRKSNAKPSEAQKAQRERIKEANVYVQAAMEDPDMRAFYEEIAEMGQSVVKGAPSVPTTDTIDLVHDRKSYSPSRSPRSS